MSDVVEGYRLFCPRIIGVACFTGCSLAAVVLLLAAGSIAAGTHYDVQQAWQSHYVVQDTL